MDSELAPSIRRATVTDVPTLAELGSATFIDAFGHLYPRDDLAAFLADIYSEAAWLRRIEEPGTAIWLATLGDAVAIGYAVVGRCKLPVANLESNAGELRQLYVRAGYRQYRLGTRLLVSALEWLAAQNRAPVYIGVWSQNTRAQRLYGRFGFEKIGEYDFPVGRHLDREFILKQRHGVIGDVGISA